MNDKSVNSNDTTVKLNMTKEQAEAYNQFIDYMVELYREYSYLLDEDE